MQSARTIKATLECLGLVLLFACAPVLAQEEAVEAEKKQEEATARYEEAALNEDPEAQRRARIEEDPELRSVWPDIEFYGSVRLHAINNFDAEDQLTEFNFGDGASRIGVRGEWQMTKRWWMLGRAEGGFDVLETFTPKAGSDEKDGLGLRKRLLYAGFDSDNLMGTYGKSWSAYYKIAGMADRFSIFGGSGVGVLVWPHILEGIKDGLLLGVVIDIGLIPVREQIAALFLRFRRDAFDVIEPDSAGRGRRAAHRLKQVEVVRRYLTTLEILVDANHVGNVLDAFSADRRAEETPVRLF